jgi:hypothetical protein
MKKYAIQRFNIMRPPWYLKVSRAVFAMELPHRKFLRDFVNVATPIE